MQSITLRSYVGPGDLAFVRIEVHDAEIEVMVHTQSSHTNTKPKPRRVSYPPDFFERTFGSLRDEPLEREPHGTTRAGASGVIYLLDTNACIGYLKRQAVGVSDWKLAHSGCGCLFYCQG